MSVIFLALTLAAESQDCSPFGVRLMPGDVYTKGIGNKTSQQYLFYNTRVACPQNSLFLNSNISVPCLSSNLTIAGPPSYSTFVYSCAMNQFNQGAMSVLFNYSLQYSVNGAPLWFNVTNAKYTSPMATAPYRILVLGNLAVGTDSAQTVSCLVSSVKTINPNFVLLFGSMGAPLQGNSFANYQSFLALIQPLSSNTPFIVLPGQQQLSQGNPNSLLLFKGSFTIGGSSYNYESTVMQLGYANLLLTDSIKASLDTGNSSLTQLQNRIDDVVSKALPYQAWNILVTNFPFQCSDSNCRTASQKLAKVNAKQVQLLLSPYYYYQRLNPSIDYVLSSFGVNSMPDNSIEYSSLGGPVQVIEGDAGSPLLLTSAGSSAVSAFQSFGQGFGVLIIDKRSYLKYSHWASATCKVTDSFAIKSDVGTERTVPVVVGCMFSFLAILLVCGLVVYNPKLPLCRQNFKPSKIESLNQSQHNFIIDGSECQDLALP